MDGWTDKDAILVVYFNVLEITLVTKRLKAWGYSFKAH